jgi:uncharacterized membrane protein
MLQGKNLVAIVVIVTLVTGDLVFLLARHGEWAVSSSWLALLPYLIAWAAITALSVYTVLKNDENDRTAR